MPKRTDRPHGRSKDQRGFVLVWLLFFLAALGVGMAALGTVWYTAAQREKEKELLFAGDQYRRAILGFWMASPQGQERLPRNFGELLSDPRFPHTVRHLRRLYADPMTGQAEWGVVEGPGKGIMGVRSLSEAVPGKTAGFPVAYEHFQSASTYRDWVFGMDIGADGRIAAVKGTQETGPHDSDGQDVEADADTSSPPDVAPQDRQAWLNKVASCERNRQAEYLACYPYHSAGDPTGWRACTGQVMARYGACLK